jgi:hypothetical protein
MLRRVALVRTDVSEARIASIIRLTRSGKLGTTLRLLVTANVVPSSQILVTMMKAIRSSETSEEPHGVTSQKKEFLKYKGSYSGTAVPE